MYRRNPKRDRQRHKSARHRNKRDGCHLRRGWDPKPAHVRADLDLAEVLSEHRE